jgi:hypothetical protein
LLSSTSEVRLCNVLTDIIIIMYDDVLFFSGKQIFERFKLRQEWSPVVFATAPWTAGRVQVPPGKLSRGATHIANYVSSAMVPREKQVVNDKEFQESCGAKFAAARDGDGDGDGGGGGGGSSSTCILVLKGALFSETQQDSVRALVKTLSLSLHKQGGDGGSSSTTAVVSVDSKLRWLALESKSAAMAASSSKFSMRVYAVRNGSRYMALDAPPTSENTLDFAKNAIKVSIILLLS